MTTAQRAKCIANSVRPVVRDQTARPTVVSRSRMPIMWNILRGLLSLNKRNPIPQLS